MKYEIYQKVDWYKQKWAIHSANTEMQSNAAPRRGSCATTDVLCPRRCGHCPAVSPATQPKPGEPFNPDFLTRLWSIRPNRNYLGNPIQSFSVPLFVKKGMIALPFFHPLPAVPCQFPAAARPSPRGLPVCYGHCRTKQGQGSSLLR